MIIDSTLSDQENLKLIANRFGLAIATDLSQYDFVKNQIQKVTYQFCKMHRLLPLEQNGDTLVVAVANPFDLKSLENLRCLTELSLKEILVSQEHLELAIEQCYQQKQDAAAEAIAKIGNSGIIDLRSESDGYDLLDENVDSPVIQMLNMILREAIQQGASDIHFEPRELGLKVRYRIDGVLQQRHSPAKEYQSQLITRIKVMAQLDIAEHRLPQDGRIKLRLSGREIDFRVSTIPIVYGERVVLRILDKGNIVLGLEHIGIRDELLKQIRYFSSLTEGIILVTGPTGSGKTTTLYSALSEINSSEANIMTIEDPVEYKLPGIAQIGVNPKIELTFARGLRHILRQDPDVIMIGEIRDPETAEIAIQSSLTGHLVLSTLHTNDAPSALTRLVDMGIEPYLLSSSVVAVLAQRLVRTICSHCRYAYTPSEEELLEIGLNPEECDQLHSGKGCEACFDSGYKGRHGIYELMRVSNRIKRQINTSADALELQKCALEEGMSNLRREGALLAKKGITTSCEVLRVTRGCEEG